MEKSTKTKSYKDIKATKSTTIVSAILKNLELREGFKLIFPEIPKDVYKELKSTLASIVEEIL